MANSVDAVWHLRLNTEGMGRCGTQSESGYLLDLQQLDSIVHVVRTEGETGILRDCQWRMEDDDRRWRIVVRQGGVTRKVCESCLTAVSWQG